MKTPHRCEGRDLRARLRAPLRGAARAAAAAALGFLVLAIGPGCAESKRPVPPKPPPPPVTIATVSERAVPLDLNSIGNVEAHRTVSLKAQVAGQIESVAFNEGDEVAENALLFVVDRKPFQAAVRQAEAGRLKDKAQAENARAQADRYAKLAESGAVSKEEAEQYRTSAAALDAAVEADDAAVAMAKLQLGYCEIRSPMAGRTGDLMVHAGNVVKQNETTLVVIEQIAPIDVTFKVIETQLASIVEHQREGRLRLDVILPGSNARITGGNLSFIDNKVDMMTGQIQLKGSFPNQDRRLWPGQYASVVLSLLSDKPSTVVPSEAIQIGQNGPYVFVVAAGDTVEARPVVPGRSAGGEAIVERGLMAGERVVTDGQIRLLPGMKVDVRNPESAPSSRPESAAESAASRPESRAGSREKP